MVRKHTLGRGLDALLGSEEIRTEGSSSINEVPLSQIIPNPNQPRREFDEVALSELASSIGTIGLIQPISLRKMPGGDYQIIAGERRFRAAIMAGLTQIPAYIKTAEDDLVLEMALIENIQREDLNAIEIALAFQKLLEIYQLTQEKLSDRLGKKRATIANYLRLLKLPADIQLGLKNRKIDMGHARALIGIEDPAKQLEIYEALIANGYSVRKVEELVRAITDATSTPKTASSTKKEGENTTDAYLLLQKMLSEQLETDVRFSMNKQGKGSITIPFKSEAQLETLLAHLDKLMR